MPAFCDVVLPVPLDQAFTYQIKAIEPPVGGRVVVPFRNEKLIGVVVRVHDDQPAMETRPIETVLDQEPILSRELMDLAAWIAQYYVAPLGEVLRGMLPLTAEVRRSVSYRISETGQAILFEGAQQGSSRRSRRSPEEQDAEYAVLNYLAGGEPAKGGTLRRKSGASAALLAGMLRKKWILRETEAAPRDARRMVRYAVLVADVRPPKLNDNQLGILAELAGAGGSLPVQALRSPLRSLTLPATTLPSLVKRGLVKLEDRPAAFHLTSATAAAGHVLNADQRGALASIVEALAARQFAACLLHGVTGSGKTVVYLAAMERALEDGRSAILLVPEIGLTPAMAAQLHTAFGDRVALLHSSLTPDERAEQWYRIRRGEARIIVGTRSAIFAPAQNLGLIIVDEEHDGSYKQEEIPRYHARDVAVVRAKLNQATVLLGSATPSLESWRNADTGKYALIEMKQRVMERPLPRVDLVDMRQEYEQTGKEALFSRELLTRAQATLDRGEQVIILLNRRGYSFAVLCRACGEKMQCENCAIALTHHKPMLGVESPTGQRLRCHYCGYQRTVPRTCPKCESEHLFYLGAGSQQGEERLQELFPGARIGRMDRDTIRNRFDMEHLLQRLHRGDINLLVGTQMIAKGHDIHGVTFVGVVGADHALSLPDFRAAERVFQLLTQVSGRAGRGELPGNVLIQTFYPEHYAIQCAALHDFHAFAKKEMQYRKWMHYPPYAVLANVMLQSPRLEEAAAWATSLGKYFAGAPPEQVRVLGPASAPISRIKRIYRFHLLLKAENRQALARTLRTVLVQAEALAIPRRSVIIDVDAVNLM